PENDRSPGGTGEVDAPVRCCARLIVNPLPDGMAGGPSCQNDAREGTEGAASRASSWQKDPPPTHAVLNPRQRPSRGNYREVFSHVGAHFASLAGDDLVRHLCKQSRALEGDVDFRWGLRIDIGGQPACLRLARTL